MARFGERSLALLQDVHPDLVDVLQRAILVTDFSVTTGHRSIEEQQRLYAQGRTTPGRVVTQIDGVRKLGMHNHKPSRAVDIYPYPVDFHKLERFYFLAGVIKTCAAELNMKVRWGGDWDSDDDFYDQGFTDLPHFELVATSPNRTLARLGSVPPLSTARPRPLE